LTALVLAASLLSALAGCVEEPLPQRRVTPGDCLLELKLSDLRNARQRCDKVVQAFPTDPAPLNDRFLIHSLLGDNSAACADIRKAVKLAARLPAQRLDPLLRRDLAQRLDSCRN
jgi:hypothetical protein